MESYDSYHPVSLPDSKLRSCSLTWNLDLKDLDSRWHSQVVLSKVTIDVVFLNVESQTLRKQN